MQGEQHAMTADQPRCECPEEMLSSPLFEENYSSEEKKAWGHMPGKCPSRSLLRRYRRDDEVLWLCTACESSTDVWLDGPDNT